MKPDLSGLDPTDVNLATRVCVGDAIGRCAAMFPDRVAIADRAERVSYHRLNETAESLAASLVTLVGQRQSPVTMLMSNSWRFLATYFACAKASLVAMPVNVTLSPSDIEWIIADAASPIVVVDAAFASVLDLLLANLPSVATVVVIGDATFSNTRVAVTTWDGLAADGPGRELDVLVEDRDTLQCLYTSGTTSRPKGVLVSHVSVLIASLTNALMMEHHWGSDPSVLLNVLPLFHTTALNTLCLPVLVTGGTVVLPGPFDAGGVLDAVESHGVTHMMLLPMMWDGIVREQEHAPRNVSTVRRAVYAMAPMSRELLDRVDEVFTNAAVILGSGQTEVVPATVLQWPEHRVSAPESWGPSVPTVRTECLDLDGRVVAVGEVGEIAYRGPHVASGYWNNRDANTAAYAHGWFHSGDIGRVDADGVVWFTDRLKDIIKTGGENVSSVDVERIVSSAPGVAESVIVGVADAYWGEAVCAVVVPDGSVDPTALPDLVVAYAKANLAGFQVPKRVVVTTQLPKTATGKTRKHEVRDWLAHVNTAPPAAATEPE